MSKVIPDRKHNRLPDYDYTSPAYYFITICIENKKCHFGEIVEEEMVLNDYGEIVQSEWEKLFDKYPLIRKDWFIVMPNHFHGILIIDDAEDMIKEIIKDAAAGVGTT